jgi:hypothetical protein
MCAAGRNATESPELAAALSPADHSASSSSVYAWKPVGAPSAASSERTWMSTGDALAA